MPMYHKSFRYFFKAFVVVILLHQSNFILSQTEILGIPFIDKFLKIEYSGGSQNWDSDVLSNGHILIANDKGLLEYDGVKWKTHPLPNKTIARSLCITDNRIYVGGQDEIGYFSTSQNGTLQFHSIRHFIPEMFLPLQDVWQLIHHNQKLYARSVNRIYIFDPIKETFEVLDPNNAILSMLLIEDEIYFTPWHKGIVSISDTSVVHPHSYLQNKSPIIDVVSIANNHLYITARYGIFYLKDDILVPTNTKTHDYLIKNVAISTARLSKDRIAIGTQFGGVVIMDKNGSTLRKIDDEDGLTSNNAHTICEDDSGHIWIGTSNGINRVALESALEVVPSNSVLEGTFYSITAHDKKLYFGSNNALYCSVLSSEFDNFSEREYSKIRNSEGQVWGLNVIDGDLLMGHDKGAYQIRNGAAELISEEAGAWKFVEARNEKEMYVGTYNGIDIYKKKNNKWKLFKRLEGFVESSRIMISVRKNEVWVSHPYRGVYKIQHNDEYFVEQVTLYDERYGLPSTLVNYIFEINGIPYVAAETGIFYYDIVQDRFVKDAEINKNIDSTKNVRRLFQEKKDKIWFLAEHEVGYLLKKPDGGYSKKIYPNLIDKFVNGFEEMYFFTENQALICGIDHVLCLDLNHKIDNAKPRTYITKTQLTKIHDSLLFAGSNSIHEPFSFSQSSDQIPVLDYDQNEIVITHSSPTHKDGTTYSYALTKGDKTTIDTLDWSFWSNQTSKEYNNLRSGNYTYNVRAKSQNGIIGDYATYKFTIKPPWYYSNYAKIIYFLLVCGAIAALFFIPRKKYQEEKKILTIAKEESEAELENIKNEKLKSEIDFKNTELASSTMHLVQKNETINKLRLEIQNVSKKIKDPSARKEIRKILSLFSDDDRLEDEWEKFSRHFDKVHTDFLKRITSAHPQLTPKDKKLCAYLRMNLSTKEIAPLLNISVRGVEISRYRLRKKLELDGDINLNEFMMGF